MYNRRFSFPLNECYSCYRVALVWESLRIRNGERSWKGGEGIIGEHMGVTATFAQKKKNGAQHNHNLINHSNSTNHHHLIIPIKRGY